MKLLHDSMEMSLHTFSEKKLKIDQFMAIPHNSQLWGKQLVQDTADKICRYPLVALTQGLKVDPTYIQVQQQKIAQAGINLHA